MCIPPPTGPHPPHTSQGQGRIWSNDITCDGTELGVGLCKHRAWGGLKLDPAGFGPACDHSGDVSVECGPQPREPWGAGSGSAGGGCPPHFEWQQQRSKALCSAPTACTPRLPAVELRLAGGTANAGRLEIKLNGQWGTVSLARAALHGLAVPLPLLCLPSPDSCPAEN